MSDDNTQPRWLTYKQAAEYLSMSVRKLQDLPVPKSRIPGTRIVRIDINDLDTYLTSTKQTAIRPADREQADHSCEPLAVEEQLIVDPRPYLPDEDWDLTEEELQYYVGESDDVVVVLDPVTLAPADEDSRRLMRIHLGLGADQGRLKFIETRE